jgi:hypothetical protein
VGDEGKVYISEAQLERVVILDSKGKKLGEWGKAGLNAGELSGPSKIVFGPDGLLYIRDNHFKGNDPQRYATFLQRFTKDGTFVDWTKILGSVDEDSWNSLDLGFAVGPDGAVYVAETSGTLNIGHIARYPPASYKPTGQTGKIIGKVVGFDKVALQYLTVRVDGVQNGTEFFGSVRPTSSGQFKILRFPVGVDFTLKLIGYDKTKYTCDPATGTGTTKSKGNKLILKRK